MDITATFDGSDLARLAGSDARLKEEFQTAIDEVGTDLLAAIPANMNFMHSSGTLEGSFQMSGSGLSREIGSGVAYAHRREFSFHGPDSLGRVFPSDPAAYYMRAAVAQVGPSIDGRLQTAADNAFGS